MGDSTLLTDQFLIAMPALADPNFHQTVSYLCDHNEEGAMGLIINRPTGLSFGELLQHVGIKIETDIENLAEIPIYQGGPVQTERGFVLHRPLGDWEATLAVTNTIGMTMSQDIIEAIAQNRGPTDFLITLGYAGWGTGQLEQEIAANAWLNGPADAAIIFEQPSENRWTSSAALLGVQLDLLSTDVGHA